MKVYTRTDGHLVGTLFTQAAGKNYALLLLDGRWFRSGWGAERLTDTACFRLVGNNFKLKC